MIIILKNFRWRLGESKARGCTSIGKYHITYSKGLIFRLLVIVAVTGGKNGVCGIWKLGGYGFDTEYTPYLKLLRILKYHTTLVTMGYRAPYSLEYT